MLHVGIANEKVFLGGPFASEFLAIMSSNLCGNYGNVLSFLLFFFFCLFPCTNFLPFTSIIWCLLYAQITRVFKGKEHAEVEFSVS